MKKAFVLFALFLLGQNLWGQWKSLSTTYLEIIFEEEDLDSALVLSSFGDQVYKEMNQWWGRDPGKLKVVLNGETDLANGYFGFAPNRLVLHLSAPPEPFLSSQEKSWLQTLFTHELAHYFHLASARGFFGGLSTLFGPTALIIPRGFAPLWAVEGVAVHLETAMGPGGRGRNAAFSLPLKALLYEDKDPSLALGDLPSSVLGFGSRPYLFGYHWVKTLEEMDPGSYSRIDDLFKTWPFFGWGFSVWASTGISESRIWENSLERLKRDWEEDFLLFEGEELNLPGVIRALPLPTEKGLIWSLADDYRSGGLYRNGSLLVADQMALGNQFSASADGLRLAWARYEPIQGPTLPWAFQSQILLKDLDGDLEILPESGVFHPLLSASGETLYYTQVQGETHSLWKWDRTKNEKTLLFEKPGYQVVHLALEPQEGRLAFILLGDEQSSLWLWEEDGVRALLSWDDGSIHRPLWKDSGILGFIGQQQGSLALYLLDLEQEKWIGVQRDPVGVLDGVFIQGELWYLSLRSHGYQVFKSSDLEPYDQPIPWSQERPWAIQEVPKANSVFKDYLDLPIVHLWAPYIGFTFDQGRLSNQEFWQYGLQIQGDNLGGTQSHYLRVSASPQGVVEGQWSMASLLWETQIQSSLFYAFKEGESLLSYALAAAYPLWSATYPLPSRLHLLTRGAQGLQWVDGPLLENNWSLQGGLGWRFTEAQIPRKSLFGGNILSLELWAGTQGLSYRPGYYSNIAGALRLGSGPLRLLGENALGTGARQIGEKREPWGWAGALGYRADPGERVRLMEGEFWGLWALDLQLSLWNQDMRLGSLHFPALGLGLYSEQGYTLDSGFAGDPFLDLGAYLSGEVVFGGLGFSYSLGGAMAYNWFHSSLIAQPRYFLALQWNPRGKGIRGDLTMAELP